MHVMTAHRNGVGRARNVQQHQYHVHATSTPCHAAVGVTIALTSGAQAAEAVQ